LLLSLLAVFAVGAVASSSAFAVQEYFTCNANAAGKYTTSKCNVLAPPKAFELEKIPAAGKVKIEGSSTIGTYTHPNILEGEIGGVRVIVECLKDKVTGELEEKGKSKGKVEFTECKLFQVANRIKELLGNCKVTNIIFNFIDQLIAGKGIGNEDEFKPAAGGTIFVEIELTGALCGITPKINKVELTEAGKGVPGLIIEPNVSEEEHVLIFTGTGDEFLRFGEKAEVKTKASFYSVQAVKLESKAGWTAE